MSDIREKIMQEKELRGPLRITTPEQRTPRATIKCFTPKPDQIAELLNDSLQIIPERPKKHIIPNLPEEKQITPQRRHYRASSTLMGSSLNIFDISHNNQNDLGKKHYTPTSSIMNNLEPAGQYVTPKTGRKMIQPQKSQNSPSSYTIFDQDGSLLKPPKVAQKRIQESQVTSRVILPSKVDFIIENLNIISNQDISGRKHIQPEKKIETQTGKKVFQLKRTEPKQKTGKGGYQSKESQIFCLNNRQGFFSTQQSQMMNLKKK